MTSLDLRRGPPKCYRAIHNSSGAAVVFAMKEAKVYSNMMVELGFKK